MINWPFPSFFCLPSSIIAVATTMLLGALGGLQRPMQAMAMAASASASASNASAASCRCFPGDSCWPTTAQWNEFNRTLGGKLVAATPMAAVCHHDGFVPYNLQQCSSLRDVWFYPETHLESSSSAMAALFTNNSCNPFAPADAPCSLGNYVRYSVNVTHVSDIQKTIEFVTRANIRLVIRNTGHDYNGKSTGAGAVAIWMHHLKSVALEQRYNTSYYTGRAVKVGAGVDVLAAYRFADAHKGLVVGGNGPTVGISGGLTQGGGHGPLASTYGLASDSVLEWEVVTGTGQLLTATPNHNADLYWALCGGGGGTFGVVVSMTTKLHPALSVAAANLTFAANGSNADHFYDVVQTFVQSLPALVDAGIQVTWSLTPPGLFVMHPAIGPGIPKQTLDSLLQLTLDRLKRHGIQHVYYSHETPTFLQSYDAMITPSNVSDSLMVGRLIPRSLVESDVDSLVKAIRSIIASNIVMVGISLNVSKSVPTPDAVATNPYWRRTLIHFAIGTYYNYTDWNTNMRNQASLTEDILPRLERLTPGGGRLSERSELSAARLAVDILRPAL